MEPRASVSLASWLLHPGSRDFFVALIECGEKGKWRPEDMLQLIACECDFRSVRNKAGYSGLTQIGAQELSSFGWSTQRDGPFHLAPPATQIRRGTFPYFEQKRKNPVCKVPPEGWQDAAHLWHANLAPGHVGREDGIVYLRLTHRQQYAANARLDANNDGVIDREDLKKVIARDVEANRASMVVALEALSIVREEMRLKACLPSV
jgi:hypothetical protein